ncbi:GNAT family N-acetyltransferase [Salipiger sp. 1_MG-2023]|uniref:GNAT family N-acetyltransferase n=1 Tax=Salipiger sp. 1_MG-2023 TaxID=3062665 RepID=UPI0026E27F37|nr:GNAT family N-acetyltransferase [Salipiger sp. 1_MG-2023]MDO6585565.1 GNAT family N-acetyltransferase [Salipiger sp. 1_MG-2023]
MESLALPLTQSPEYARTLAALGLSVRCGSSGPTQDPDMRWLVQSRRLPLLGQIDLISRGPVCKTAACPEDWLPLARGQRRTPLLLNAAQEDGQALRAAGFWPVMTAASLAILPLGDNDAMRAAMHQKWRNRLNRTARVPLKITRHPLSGGHWIMRAEALQARTRQYRALPPALIAAYARENPGKALIWEARHNGTAVASIAILLHGPMATWQMGVSLPEGRRLNAMNALLWEAMQYLADKGHRLLDLGILNSDDAPGLIRFKLGTGAKLHRLGGSWLHLGALASIARHLPQRLSA